MATEYAFTQADGSQIVATHDGGAVEFFDAGSRRFADLLENEQIAAYSEPAPEVPQVVSARQARLALLGSGRLEAVDAFVNASEDEALKINWEYATEIRRDSPILQAAAQAFQMSSGDLDALMIVAAAIAD